MGKCREKKFQKIKNLFLKKMLSNNRLPDVHPVSDGLAGGHGGTWPGYVEEGLTSTTGSCFHLLPHQALLRKGGVASACKSCP